jgi:hypothetical protein
MRICIAGLGVLALSLALGCAGGDSVPASITEEQLERLNQEQQDAEQLERQQRQSQQPRR